MLNVAHTVILESGLQSRLFRKGKPSYVHSMVYASILGYYTVPFLSLYPLLAYAYYIINKCDQ